MRVSDGKDTTTSAATTVTVNNAVPNATVSNSGPVTEGTTATVSFANVTDPSAADTAAGFRYGYDFNNDGTYEVGGTTYAAAVTATSATVPASFLPTARARARSGWSSATRTASATSTRPRSRSTTPPRPARLPNRTVDEGASVTVGLTGVADVAADCRPSATSTTSTATAPTTPPRVTYANASDGGDGQRPGAR